MIPMEVNPYPPKIPSLDNNQMILKAPEDYPNTPKKSELTKIQIMSFKDTLMTPFRTPTTSIV